MRMISQSGSSDSISWKLVSIGTIVVLAAIFIFWLARTAAGERALLEQQKMNEIAAESKALCEEWGMFADSIKHSVCLADIQAVRDQHARRTLDDLGPF